MHKTIQKSKTKGRTKPDLNPRNLPIPHGEDAALFELSGDSDSTPGANNFMRMLNRIGIKYEPIKRDTNPTADFVIEIDGVKVVAEVTDVAPNELDDELEQAANELGVVFPESIGPLTTRNKIVRKCSKKQSQLEKPEYSSIPKMLVLFNTCAQPYLRHDFVKSCLYQQVKDLKALFLDDRQRTISVIACMDNGADAEGVISFVGPPRLRLYFNPLAAVSLKVKPFLNTEDVTCFWFDKELNEIATNCKNEFALRFTTA